MYKDLWFPAVMVKGDEIRINLKPLIQYFI